MGKQQSGCRARFASGGNPSRAPVRSHLAKAPTAGPDADAGAGAGTMLTADRVVPYAFAEISSRVATATVLGFVAGYLLS
jgi:hypothetical protein